MPGTSPLIPVILFSHMIDGVTYSFYAVALVLFIGEVAPSSFTEPG